MDDTNLSQPQQPTRKWKEFIATPAPPRKGPYASVTANGRIVLNLELWQQLGSPKWVSLLYDEDNRSIGIRAVSEIMPNSFPVAFRPRGTTAWVRAEKFLAQEKIQITYCIRFLDPHMEGSTLILDLRQTARVPNVRGRAQ